MSDDASTLLAQLLADRYRIERQIGQGGMATVYLAEDVKLGRHVALKVLRPELGAVLGSERFLTEVKITARLDHPHILTLIDSGNAGGMLYYVLPYVRGESLRDLLDRESQLSIDQALMITRHVASALDYAHRNGVIHRDIKPENILLQEGEAMLADFGIALAVQESGAGRLTETGLSLGTPFYMSPEQATGERSIDARSDLYSLASVLYEMLVGEPPITGKTTHAVIAKLLTEPAMHVRTVRDTVPVHVDLAIMKALSKVPADRFANVAEFSRALAAGPQTAVTGAMIAADHARDANMATAAAAAKPRSRAFAIAGSVAAIAVLGVGAYFATQKASATTATSAALRDRTQLTFTGNVSMPALSPDGKQLTYFLKSCKGVDCTFAVDVQDVSSTTSRHILEGVTAAYGLSWSDDRRNLLVGATIGGRYGAYIVSTLGGAPRFLTSGAASFYSNGDSLMLGAAGGSDSSFVVRFAGLDGTVRDSVRIPGPGASLGSLVAIPGSSRFVSLVIQQGRGLWQVHERTGAVTDKILNSCTCGAVASRDALWMSRAGPTAAEAVVRVALDPATGKFAAQQDTIYSGRFSNLSVSADGATMTVDDGSFNYLAMAGTVPELTRAVAAGETLLQASTAVSAVVSPDGARLLLRRSVPSADGGDQLRYSWRAFSGGSESPINLAGNVRGARWIDSVTIGVRSFTPTGGRFSRVDVRTSAATGALDIKDSLMQAFAPLPDGWAWIPAKGDRAIIERNGKRTEIVKSAWFDNFFDLDASPDGSRLALMGWNLSTSDTIGVDVYPTTGGAGVPWSRAFAELGIVTWMYDGSLVFGVWTGTDAVSIRHLTGPGQEKEVGRVGHIARGLTVSRDLKRATLVSRENHSDAWMYRVVKP